jgi:hypothetical protein
MRIIFYDAYECECACACVCRTQHVPSRTGRREAQRNRGRTKVCDWILDRHSRPFRTILGPTIFDRSGPNHFRPFRTILGPTIFDRSGPNHFRPFSTKERNGRKWSGRKWSGPSTSQVRIPLKILLTRRWYWVASAEIAFFNRPTTHNQRGQQAFEGTYGLSPL